MMGGMGGWWCDCVVGHGIMDEDGGVGIALVGRQGENRMGGDAEMTTSEQTVVVVCCW